MNLVQAVVVFGVTWWLVFFMTLPFGVRHDEPLVPGQEPGAPSQPRLRLKAGITTLVAVVLTLGIHLIVRAGVVSFRAG